MTESYPKTDDLMYFDEERGRYVLTEEALRTNGTDLRARLAYNRSIDPASIINRHLRRVSDVIYNYIHTFSSNTKLQDELIAKTPSLRSIIYDAMLAQSEYMLLVGDLSRSPKIAERELAVDESAKLFLNETVPELGHAITYAG